jgi:hypothetical protein
VRRKVVARVRFLDAGLEDPKYICSTDPLGAVDRLRVNAFFSFYAQAKRALNLARGKRGNTEYGGIEEP